LNYEILIDIAELGRYNEYIWIEERFSRVAGWYAGSADDLR
jgi:hypothetical protein